MQAQGFISTSTQLLAETYAVRSNAHYCFRASEIVISGTLLTGDVTLRSNTVHFAHQDWFILDVLCHWSAEGNRLSIDKVGTCFSSTCSLFNVLGVFCIREFFVNPKRAEPFQLFNPFVDHYERMKELRFRGFGQHARR